MTTVAQEPLTPDPGTVVRPGRGKRPKQNFETWTWFFMRISGLVLIFLSLSHFAITHIINDVVETDASFVAERWDNPLWRLFDWTLLALALGHGLNGVRWSIDDYVSCKLRRGALKVLIYGVSGILFAYGTLTILTYEPDSNPARSGEHIERRYSGKQYGDHKEGPKKNSAILQPDLQ